MLILRRYDPRTRRDRVERENEEWDDLYELLTTAYMHWDLHGAPDVEEEAEEGLKHPKVLTVDMKCESSIGSL